MTAVFFDPLMGDEARRGHLYSGDLVVYSPSRQSAALCDFARVLIREAFGSLDPELAQFEMPVREYAASLAKLKPHFIHHPETKRLVRDLLRSLGCAEEKTYFDVPRLRSSTSDNYLTTGIAYAFHAHRDTWYSAPMSQINVWMPVFATRPDNIMAFHPRHWSEPVPNTSADYDYQRWNATNRFNAAEHIGTDTRAQPKALVEIAAQPDVRVVTPVGGIKMFSAAQMHSSIENTSGRTRFSLDFRVVNIDDTVAGIGAPNLDSFCTGTSLPDFLRVSDLRPVDDEVVQRYMPRHPQPPQLDSRAA
jgi:hypothetical protein